MILAVDAGNSTIVVGAFRKNEEVRRLGRLPTDAIARDPERTRARLLTMVPGEVEGAVLSTVVPGVRAPLSDALAAIAGEEPLLVGPEIDLGIRLGYERPSMIGPDRIAGAVAGRAAAKGGGVIVVDFGTATTFSAVSEEGVFLGGAIAAGVLTAAGALAQRAARLFEPDLEFPERVIGDSTESSLRSGSLWGAVALTDGMIERIRAEMGGAFTVATGGLGTRIGPRCRSVDLVDEDLTLKGLKLLYERNRMKK